MVSPVNLKGVIILGPTASGKTHIAHQLVRSLQKRGSGYRLINLDTRQMICDFSIGTAKPTPDEQREYGYYGLDIVKNEQSLNAKNFRHVLDDLLLNCPDDEIPILIVGSPFYFYCWLHPEPTGLLVLSPFFRNFLKNWVLEQPREIWFWIKRQDPGIQFAWQDLYRVTRYIEKWFEGSLSQAQSPLSNLFQKRDWSWIQPSYTREDLKIRIRMRIDTFWEQGWPEEVSQLLTRYIFDPQSLGWRSIGYSEIAQALRNPTHYSSIEALKDQIAQKTWQYARKQINWIQKLSRDHLIQSIKIDDCLAIEKLVANTLLPK